MTPIAPTPRSPRILLSTLGSTALILVFGLSLPRAAAAEGDQTTANDENAPVAAQAATGSPDAAAKPALPVSDPARIEDDLRYATAAMKDTARYADDASNALNRATDYTKGDNLSPSQKSDSRAYIGATLDSIGDDIKKAKISASKADAAASDAEVVGGKADPGAMAARACSDSASNAFVLIMDANIKATQYYANATGATLTSNPSVKTNAVPDIFAQASLWSGAKLSNPYTINRATHTLTNASTTADAYIEFDISSRYILRTGQFSDITFTSDKSEQLGKPYWALLPLRMPDFDGQFGYLFRGNSSGPSNYNANAIVGSSDIYADSSIGIPILRFCSSNSLYKAQVSMELNGGFATDRDNLVIHPYFFVGPGFQMRFPAAGIGSTNYTGYWMGRAGAALIDQPEFLSSSTNGVKFSSQTGGAEYHTTWCPSCGLILVYPLTSAVSLQAGYNVYFADQPASWNATLGMTLDLGKFFGSNPGQ